MWVFCLFAWQLDAPLCCGCCSILTVTVRQKQNWRFESLSIWTKYMKCKMCHCWRIILTIENNIEWDGWERKACEKNIIHAKRLTANKKRNEQIRTKLNFTKICMMCTLYNVHTQTQLNAIQRTLVSGRHGTQIVRRKKHSISSDLFKYVGHE